MKGAGAKTAQKLERIDLLSVQDLLFHLPLRYEDRTQLTPIAQTRAGESVLVEGNIVAIEIRQGARRSHLVHIQDASGRLTLRFFHFTRHQELQFVHGRRLRCFGEVRFGFQGLELSHPDYEFPYEEAQSSPQSCLTPVYPITEGVHQKTLRQLVSQALEHINELQDVLECVSSPFPAGPSLSEALIALHRPSPGLGLGSQSLTNARRRLAYEELLAHHLSLSRHRSRMRNQRAPELKLPAAVHSRFLASLPFKLTSAQERVIEEVLKDLDRSSP